MKIKTFKLTALAVALLIATSCSPRLAGTWNVDRFETGAAGQQGVVLTNIGTIAFKKNGTGEKNINYVALNVEHTDKQPFKWVSNEGEYVTIEGEKSIEGENSPFAKTWIVVTNKKRLQLWKSTDGSNNVQTIQLSKPK